MQTRFPVQIVILAAAVGVTAGAGIMHEWHQSRWEPQNGQHVSQSGHSPMASGPWAHPVPAPDVEESHAGGETTSSDALSLHGSRPVEGVTGVESSMESLVEQARLDPEARERLFRAFLSSQGDERGVWLASLRRLKGDEVKRFALDSLNDSDPSVRMAAYQMLQDYAPTDSDLQAMLARQVMFEPEAAAKVTLLESVSPSQLSVADLQVARQALESLANDADPGARSAALALLSARYLEGAERAQRLAEGLEDPDAQVRTSALASLWSEGSDNIRQWDRIREIATNPDESWAVRDAALALLERPGSPWTGERWVNATRGNLDRQFAASENAAY